ncbi:MAG: OmpH family outer membrane protein [Kiritimatiellales bacterium]|nr:OmpH family outer membrane protein [Kiritimatiellales bacterium]
MKKHLLIAFVLLFLASAAGAAERIVFVDLERVFNEFYKTQLAKSKVQVQQADIEAERQLMVDEMTIVNDEVDVLRKEARDVTFSQEIRDEKRILYEERVLELRDKRKEIGEFSERRQQQLQMQVSRMSQTVMDEIRGAIVEYAKQEGLQAVIDSSTRRAAVGIFIYIHPDVDVTDAMLTMLNSRRPDIVGGGESPDAEKVNGTTEEEAPEKE